MCEKNLLGDHQGVFSSKTQYFLTSDFGISVNLDFKSKIACRDLGILGDHQRGAPERHPFLSEMLKKNWAWFGAMVPRRARAILPVDSLGKFIFGKIFNVDIKN